MFVDFKQVKLLATIHQIAEWLGLKLKQNRAQCPVNYGDVRELVISPDKAMFYCFGCKVGGDLIGLAAHVNQTDQKAAAVAIQQHFHGYQPSERGLPADGLDYLQAEHDHVQALGLSPAKAKELGIGYAPRGTMIKRVLFPLRDHNGRLLGYLGYAQDGTLKLPKNLL